MEFAPIDDPAFIVPALAVAFNLCEVQGTPLIETVTDFLRAKEALLILDNCEHLVESSAKLAGHLMRACPQLKIIASTRESLGTNGETIYRETILAYHASNFSPIHFGTAPGVMVSSP